MDINKNGSPYNWKYINIDQFPQSFNRVDIKEDYDLLFQETYDPLKLKETLRNSIREPNQSVRKFLWKRILVQHDNIVDCNLIYKKYEDKMCKMLTNNLDQKSSLPAFVDHEHLIYYYLNEDGKLAVTRILCALALAHPDITYSPLLLPLASLFLHYMSEAESYSCILAVAESRTGITVTDIHWVTTCHVFRKLAKKYCGSSYDYLINATFKNGNNTEVCSKVVDDWYWWIFEHLPFNYILNIVDSFLLEGQKVLYRYGVSILDSFVKSFVRKPNVLDSNCVNLFCHSISISPENLTKSAFKWRNMSRKDLQVLFEAEESRVKRFRAKAAALGHDLFASIENTQNIDNGHDENSKYDEKEEAKDTAQSPFRFYRNKSAWKNPFKNKKTPSIKRKSERPHIGSYRSHHNHHHPQNYLNLPPFSVENTGSQILESAEIIQIWRWLPTRLQLLELETVYSTNIHGFRLLTLFDKIEYYENTIIIIKTATDSVFGAFCSQPWCNRFVNKRGRSGFFGTGETFLFRLRPTVTKYEWVGKHLQGSTEASQELFLYADDSNLSIGGGGIGMGLSIDKELQNGATHTCNTFQNEPLCSEELFSIVSLEVIAFKSA